MKCDNRSTATGVDFTNHGYQHRQENTISEPEQHTYNDCYPGTEIKTNERHKYNIFTNSGE